MKRDFSQTLSALGQPLPEPANTLGSVCVSALMGVYPDEQNLSGDDKFKRYQLAERLHAGGEQDVSAEDIALLKKLIGKNWSPAVLGPAYEALERDAPEAAPAA
jgi:hypothetical protein